MKTFQIQYTQTLVSKQGCSEDHLKGENENSDELNRNGYNIIVKATFTWMFEDHCFF